jgi:alpha-aminoadipate carrier protein LysW
MVICPECESDLDIEEDEVDEGEVVSCPECGTDFEVVAVEPLELSRVEEKDDDDKEDSEEEAEY